MIKRAALLVCLGASQAAARDIILIQPIECTLGTDCFVQHYVDADLGSGAADFTCGPLSYDGHSGTDFALHSLAAMQNGVNVLAASPGRVRAIRNNELDGAGPTEGLECGNGVVIDHGGQWETQYCHMKTGSIAVQTGQRVRMGAVLGQVGLSGNTEFPHLHFTLRRNDEVRDPFNRDDIITCTDTEDDQFWRTEMAYQSGGIIAVGMSTGVPEFQEIKAGEASVTETTAKAPALVVWAHLYGARTDDIVRLSITNEQGEILIQDDITLTKNQPRIFRAIGKRLPDTGWPVGTYTGESTLIRDGQQIGLSYKTQIIVAN